MYRENILPKAAGIYITRNCNLRCGYCNVYKKNLAELDYDRWIQTFDVLESLGIQKLTILGGEPTTRADLPQLIYHLAHNTSFDFSVVSNGTANLKTLRSLVEAGMQKYSSSVDTINGDSLDPFTTLKSKKAMSNFRELREMGVPHLTAYLVLSASSLPQVVEIAKALSEEQIGLYLLPYHYAQGGETFWETRDIHKKEGFAFETSQIPQVRGVMEELIKMKHAGYLIENAEHYLRKIPDYIVDCNWHCPDTLNELRIDSDGSLMCCHDYVGTRTPEFNIFQLAEEKGLSEFLSQRWKDSRDCPGCFWPSQFHNAIV
ncbi:coenzyme PQQ biosynthesis protein E [Paenibacillus albidus]|uniref:Coenzyme PQQ biosynthesis protein E n=1 Tax=Paenibacillus albidus TaxID=2041023 RepID=A0A917FWE7_9BACL|nr:radical SAM protein [Paenibacillus albidus]GGG07189.1 coenzyme PQQ biosynthesis protein E [Paenibacillus albidus]